jgi:hypothetical protein
MPGACAAYASAADSTGGDLRSRALRDTVLGWPDNGAALVRDRPALRDRAIEVGLILRRRALQFEHKWPADLLIQILPSWIGAHVLDEAAHHRYRPVLLV